MRVNLVIQSFGRENEYKRAILTILSFYAYVRKPLEETKVVLFTDDVNYFATYLHGIPVEYVLLTKEKIKQMRGNIDFLHRMKIALIEEAFTLIEGNMLYADSDTFFVADPVPYVSKVTPNKSFMHLWEYDFESMRTLPLPAGETFRAFLNLIESKSFKLADGSTLNVGPTDVSWNAGVMIFHPDHARFIPDVYTLTDQFYPETRNHASEQYAFSIVLQKNTDLASCDPVIYHYWYRVKKQIIDIYLHEKLSPSFAELSLQEKLAEVKAWTFELPELFTKHVLTIKDNAIQAFNEDDFANGYRFAFKALLKEPSNLDFIKDLIYHTKRFAKK